MVQWIRWVKALVPPVGVRVWPPDARRRASSVWTASKMVRSMMGWWWSVMMYLGSRPVLRVSVGLAM